MSDVSLWVLDVEMLVNWGIVVSLLSISIGFLVWILSATTDWDAVMQALVPLT